MCQSVRVRLFSQVAHTQTQDTKNLLSQELWHLQEKSSLSDYAVIRDVTQGWKYILAELAVVGAHLSSLHQDCDYNSSCLPTTQPTTWPCETVACLSVSSQLHHKPIMPTTLILSFIMHSIFCFQMAVRSHITNRELSQAWRGSDLKSKRSSNRKGSKR